MWNLHPGIPSHFTWDAVTSLPALVSLLTPQGPSVLRGDGRLHSLPHPFWVPRLWEIH